MNNKHDNKYISPKENIVASRQTKIDNGGISKCCQGLRSSAGGYIWKYEEEDKI